jgi:predicted nucleotidyltransferase
LRVSNKPHATGFISDSSLTDELIHRIVETILTRSAPEKIILFGSAASGEATADSDLDFFVIMNTTLPPLERSDRLREVLGPVEIPVVLFVLTAQEFEETKDVIGGIANTPAKYGRMVYAKS